MSIYKFQKELNLAYPQTDNYQTLLIQTVKDKITQDLKKNATGIAKAYADADMVGKIFDKGFNEQFVELMTKKVEDGFSAQNSAQPGGDIRNLGVTKRTVIEESVTSKDFSRLVSEVKALVHSAFSGDKDKATVANLMNISADDPKEFFSRLALFLETKGPLMDTYVTNCKRISEALGGKVGGQTGTVKEIVDTIYGNMLKLVGEGLWERTAAIARGQIAEKEREKIIKIIEESFALSGATVRFTSEAIGATKVSGSSSQQVGDTLFRIDITGTSGDFGQVSCSISVFDTTKFTTKTAFTVAPTAAQDKQWNSTLGILLKEAGLYDYWYKKMQPFLYGKSPDNVDPKVTSEDNSHWINTKQRIMTLHIYDMLAVRAGGGSAGTMTISGQMRTLDSLINNYWNYLGTTNAKTSVGGLDAIQRHSKGFSYNIYTGYKEYYLAQQNTSKGRSKEDERMLDTRFALRWNEIQRHKINISVNALGGF